MSFPRGAGWYVISHGIVFFSYLDDSLSKTWKFGFNLLLFHFYFILLKDIAISVPPIFFIASDNIMLMSYS